MRPVAASRGTDNREPVSIPARHLDQLLAVATLYLDAFSPSDHMSLAERMQLREVEEIVKRYGRRW